MKSNNFFRRFVQRTYRLPSTALCMIWLANTINERALNLLGSMSAWSISACISGLNVPISFDSFAQPRPRPAIPLVNEHASADDNDFDRCNEFVFEWLFDFCCWLFGWSMANFTFGAVAWIQKKNPFTCNRNENRKW